MPALAVQVKAGLDGQDVAELVKPAAANCWLAPGARLIAAGVTAMRLSVGLTITVTLLVTDSPLRSLIVAVNL